MKTWLVLAGAMMAFLLTLPACKEKNGPEKAEAERTNEHTVILESDSLTRNTVFTTSRGESCEIASTLVIQYPKQIAATDGETGISVDSLQRLFITHVLDAGDSLSLRQAIERCVDNSLHQYDFMQEEEMEDATEPQDGHVTVVADSGSVIKYVTKTTVSLIRDKDHVVTFCRVDVTNKNGRVVSLTHRYYNFDINTMSLITPAKLFRVDAVGEVNQLLRNTLLKQNNVKNNDQLNDLGYYNVENIMVSSNFYVTDDGITWSFLPNELAVEAVGEPLIHLDFDSLSPFWGQVKYFD